MDDFDAYLNSLPDKLVAELSATVREQAQMLSDAQASALMTLEQSPEETGNLHASCMVIPGDTPLEWVVVAGGDLTTKEVRTGSGVDYDYAEAFEFGTSRQHARPFFWPTYQEKRDEIVGAINDAVERILK